MGCHVILQGIFLTQGSNPCLLPLFFPCLIIYSEELCKNTWSLSFSQLYSIPLGKLYYNLFSLFPLARLWVFSVFCYNVTATVKNLYISQDFPGGPTVKTLCSQCRGHGFNPCSGDPMCHMVWCGQKKRKLCICHFLHMQVYL